MSARQPTVPLRAMVIISIVVLAVLLLASAGLATGGDDPVAPTVEYQVRSGDTLWSIAEAHLGAGADVPAAVHSIRRLNDLDGSLIHAGEVLHLPMTVSG